jgi:hypothetical protein
MFKTLYNALNEKAQLLQNKSNIINQEIELLKKKKLINKTYETPEQNEKSLYNFFKGDGDRNNIENMNININRPPRMGENNNQVKPKTFMESVKLFFRTDLYFFMKYYLYFIVLFSLCFYILIFLQDRAKNGVVIVENKVFFYIGIICLVIVFNDILETPMESLKKFVLVIIISLIVVYIVNYIIVKFNSNHKLKGNFWTVFWTTIIIYSITVFCIYYMFHRKDRLIAIDLYNAFNYSINKNLTLMIFLTIYLYLYVSFFKKLNQNTNLTDILQPAILGGLLMFFLFGIITYIAYKMKIINRVNILNSFISLFAIFIFLAFMGIKVFMDSLNEVCVEKTDMDTVNEKEFVILLIFLSLFIIWWLEDDRKWNRWSSMAFVFASVMTFYSMFVYSVTYPSIGMLSTWLMIEWIIIYFHRKENSKNSVHFSFMEI